jgi:hypothetical protein
VYLVAQQLGQRRVDQPLATDATLPDKAVRHNLDRKMALARSVMSGMAAMLFAVVDHVELLRVQGSAQPRLDFCGHRAFEHLGHCAYIGKSEPTCIRIDWASDPCSNRRFNGFHGRVESDRPCAAPGCEESGEFRAPPAEGQGSGHEGPRWRWFCLDHVRAFNQGYNFFSGMTPDEIEAAQRPFAGWDRETRAFSTNGTTPPPKWADFSDPLDAISAKFRERMDRAARAQKVREDGRMLSADDRKALDVMGLAVDADRKALRQRYTELVRRYHPDHNGGDRTHEGALQGVIAAYGHLRKAVAFA